MNRFSIQHVLRHFLMIVVMAGLLPACIIVVDEDDDDDYYRRRRWELEVIVYGSVVHRPGQSGTYTIVFQEDETFTGQADCVSFEGRYQVRKTSTLSIDQLSTADAACGGDSLSALFLQGLREARTMEGDADALTIHFEGSGNMMRLVSDRLE